jgi:hypothetical protein
MRMTIPLLGIKSYLPKLLYLHVGAALLILLSSTLLMNGVFGQIFPNTQHSGVPSTSSTLQQQQSMPNSHLVKIISPTKGQQIRVGGNLLISGTSADNTTSDCKVMVIVNGIKPYRTVFPGGGGDYSKWNYTLTSAYTSIKQGQNKITAKFSCTDDANLMLHSSVNVTGVGAFLTPTANQKERQYAGMNSTTTSVNTTSGGNATSPSVANTNSNANNSMNNNRTMSVSIHLGKRTAQPGDKQSLIIKVTDLNSTTPVVGASLLGRIIDSSGVLFKKLEGTTDDTGKSSYSWTVG